MTTSKLRYNLIDAIRGLTIISMILFHTCWDLVYFGVLSPDFMKAIPAIVWQKSICCTFIFISGFVFCLGKNHVKHGLVTLGCGILITLVTCILMPDSRDIFGVLWLLGISTFIGIIMEKILRKNDAAVQVVLILNLIFFILTLNLVKGYIGIGSIIFINLPTSLYKDYFTTLLGFPFGGFFSSDYFPILPWSFLYICGLCTYLILCKKEGAMKPLTKDVPALSFIGRHSLLIYMLHQPLVFGLLYLFFSISR